MRFLAIFLCALGLSAQTATFNTIKMVNPADSFVRVLTTSIDPASNPIWTVNANIVPAVGSGGIDLGYITAPFQDLWSITANANRMAFTDNSLPVGVGSSWLAYANGNGVTLRDWSLQDPGGSSSVPIHITRYFSGTFVNTIELDSSLIPQTLNSTYTIGNSANPWSSFFSRGFLDMKSGVAGSTTSGHGVLYFDGTHFKCSENGGAFVNCIGAGEPFPDNTALIANVSVPSKLLILDASLISSSTTRTLKAQNNNYIIAGTNLDNLFSVVQTFNAQINMGAPSSHLGRINWYSAGDSTARIMSADVDTTFGNPDITINSDFMPTLGSTYNLGEPAHPWSYIAGVTGDLQALKFSDGSYLGSWLWQNTGNDTTSEILQLTDPASSAFLILTAETSGSFTNPTGQIQANWLPTTDNLYSLGASGQAWKDLWLTGTCHGCGPGATVLFSAMTGGTLSLTTTYQDLPSASVTLTNGTWLVTGCFAWSTQGGDGSNEGQLVVNGSPQTGISAMTVTATGAVAVTATQQWVVTNSSGSVTAKLQAKNTGPTLTNADVFDVTTTISATLIHL